MLSGMKCIKGSHRTFLAIRNEYTHPSIHQFNCYFLKVVNYIVPKSEITWDTIRLINS